MKKITARNIVVLLITILVVGNCSLISVEGKDLDDCATGLSNLTWDYYTDPANSSNTCFEFEIEYQFFNPNAKDVTLSFPNLLQFVANMTIEFENTSLVAYEQPWGTFPTLSNRTFEQGVTTDHVNFTLVIEAHGLDTLPDGNYTIWVYDYRTINTDPVVIHYKTLLVIDGGDATIDFGIVFYTWPFGTMYAIIFFSALVAIVFTLNIKKKFLRRK